MKRASRFSDSGSIRRGSFPDLSVQWFVPRQSPLPLRDSSGISPDSLCTECASDSLATLRHARRGGMGRAHGRGGPQSWCEGGGCPQGVLVGWIVGARTYDRSMSVGTVRDGDSGLLPGLRDALRAVVSADMRTVWQVPDADVSDALAVIGQARQLLESAEVALVREGVTRGLPAQSSWSVHDWVSVSQGRRAPRPATGHVACVVRVAKATVTRAGSALCDPDPQGTSDATAVDGEGGGGLGGVAAVVAAFTGGDLPLGKADQLVRFHECVRRVADPDLLETDLGILLGQACDETITTGPDERVRTRAPGLDEKKLAAAIAMTARMLRPDQDLADEDAQLKASRSLVKSAGPCGMTRYRVDMDPEGAAIIDAALAALSAPIMGPEGQPDERSAARRNADALVAIISRGVAAPGEAPTSDKARVLVTISLAALTDNHGRCGACGQHRPTGPLGLPLGPFDPGGRVSGHAGGLTATGQVLAPNAVRKLACEAGIIPAILGTHSEPLELGRTARYFTPGQKRALYLRDSGCTYPSCTMPAHWCDAHHLDYWSLGGNTNIDRAALLCERHHTRVHQHDLTATVTTHGVTWHL